MMSSVAALDLGRFRGAITRHLGLHFDDSKDAMLVDVLQRRLDASGLAPGPYLDRLDGRDLVREELREVAKVLTIAETYFFRHVEQFRSFAEVALPERLAARRGDQPVRILSAGCASGEEAYSLAILLRERGVDAGGTTSVLAVDVNPGVLERAARGRFTAWALRDTPPGIAQRWFQTDGRDFVLDPSIRQLVTFQEGNLADARSTLWMGPVFDVIFCRNVLMYFAPAELRATIARLTATLAPGGYLYLGHAETLRGLSNDFHLCHTHGAFYYQRKDGPLRPVPADSQRALTQRASLARAPSDAAPASAESWMNAVTAASARINQLAGAAPAAPDSAWSTAGSMPAQAPADAPGVELAVAMELLKNDRFAEALAWLDGLPATDGDDAGVLLLRAVLLVHRGQLPDAEQACQRLLAIDELSAGAHHVLAQCRETASDWQGAREHDQIAVYLDPSFAMARLHLGLLARRDGQGSDGEAQRELARALHLLQTEDAARLLLFGGGFTRDSLIALCRRELQACGGKG